MSIITLIKANLLRNKTRTVLTLLSLISAFFLFAFLDALNFAFTEGMGVADVSRLITRNKISLIMPLPLSYFDRIKSLDGIKVTTYANWFGGVYKDRKNFFPQIAVYKDTFFDIYQEFIVSDEDLYDFKKTKNGTIVGKMTSDRYGFKKGDVIHIQGTIYAGDWEFKICGIYKAKKEGVDTSQFMFGYDYLHENMQYDIKDFAGYFIEKLKNPNHSNIISKEIDKLFENSSFETVTVNEKAFTTDYVNMMGNFKLIMLSIGMTVMLSILFVVGNTLMMSIRERTHEIAIQKVLGFSRSKIVLMTILESTFIVLLGGIIGLLFGKLVFTNLGIPIAGSSLKLVIQWQRLYLGTLLALVMGIITGLTPAWNASRLNISEALRSIQ